VKTKKVFREPSKLSKLQRSLDGSPPVERTLTSPIITLSVGREGRLFAAHEDVLCLSPFFAAACRGKFLEAESKRIDLPDEEPEIFSCVLEYLYKGDYYPRLLHNKRRSNWELEDAVNTPNPENGGGRGNVEATTFISSVGEYLLRDTVIYCVAEKYGLEELKRLALRKQGLQSGIEVATILRSARYAYDNTPDTDSRLRAHYLALSSDVARHSRGRERCRRKWRVVVNFSLIYLSRSAIMWMTLWTSEAPALPRRSKQVAAAWR